MIKTKMEFIKENQIARLSLLGTKKKEEKKKENFTKLGDNEKRRMT